jgi:TPP-dependent pyruvate/acetoin dehydrogenase alpha subunit
VEFIRNDLLRLYRNMVLARNYDEQAVDGFYAGEWASAFPPHTGIGQEAVTVGGCTFLRSDDYLVKTHRGIGHDIAKGAPLPELLAGFAGKKTGLCKGKGYGQAAYIERGIVGMSGAIGGCFPIALGLGFAARRAGKGQVVACFFGDGAAQRGTLHESMNWASVLKLPIVWICENNHYFISIHVSEAIAAENIADFAKAYSMPGEIVDGQDVLAVANAVNSAAERARQGAGPTLIECKTHYFRAHEEGSGAAEYLTENDPRGIKEVRRWMERDPIKLFRTVLLGKGFGADELAAIDRRAEQEVRHAFAFAAASPFPEPEAAWEDMYAGEAR